MLNFDDYINTDRYPRKEDFATWYAYKKEHAIKIEESSIRKYKEDGWVVIPDYDDNSLNNAFKKHKEKSDKLIETFFDDIKKDLGIEDHPKADKLTAIAWDFGFCQGFETVYFYARKLKELLE